MFEKVLLACDGSDTARRAIDYAVALKQQWPQMAVTLLAVAPVAHEVYEGPFEPSMDGSWQREIKEMAEGWAQAGLERFKAAGLSAETAVSAGDAGAEIPRFAEAGGFDHIIMGSHGRSGLGAVLLGSVARKVLHFAHCPVIVVRGADSE